MRTCLLAGLILLAACSAGSSAVTPPTTSGGQPPAGGKAIPWSLKSETNDGYTIVVEFQASACTVVGAAVDQTATVTKVTLTPTTPCEGSPVTRERRIRLQSHYFPCMGHLIDGATGKTAPVAKDAHLPEDLCPGAS